MHGSDSSIGDWPLVHLAERQEGLLRHAQLAAAGLSDDTIFSRLRTGRLHRRQRGVYTLGHRLLSPRGRWMAAVWTVPGSVLSHQSAAAFHGWLEPHPALEHVTTIRTAGSRPGLRVHRVTSLYAIDVEHHPHLVVTTPVRTLLDLAVVLPFAELRAIADRVRRPDPVALRAARARAPYRAGARSIERLCGRLEAHTRSEFERRYLRFCRRHRLPLPDAVNVGLAGFLVDCRYPRARVVVELDGRAFHVRQDQMRADRRRDRRLARAGWLVVRLTWEDLDEDEAELTIADLRDLL